MDVKQQLATKLVASHKKLRSRGSKRDLAFYTAFMIWPVLHFCVFYIAINFNSLLLTFQKIDLVSGTTTWTLFGNLGTALDRIFTNPELVEAFGNSLLAYFVPLVIATPLALLFSYYIYKKMPLAGLFRVMLFLPSIISAIVMSVIFKFFVDSAIPEFVGLITGGNKMIEGMMANPDTRFGTIMFYNIWGCFGVNCLMYVNAMNDIPPEQVEAAHLDGATGFKEFWFINLPNVFSTLATFLIAGVAGLFTNQFNLFNFYGDAAPAGLTTYGYWMYKQTLYATSSPAQMPIVAAMGIWMTLVAVPLTLLVRKLFDKFGPSAE